MVSAPFKSLIEVSMIKKIYKNFSLSLQEVVLMRLQPHLVNKLEFMFSGLGNLRRGFSRFNFFSIILFGVLRCGKTTLIFYNNARLSVAEYSTEKQELLKCELFHRSFTFNGFFPAFTRDYLWLAWFASLTQTNSGLVVIFNM